MMQQKLELSDNLEKEARLFGKIFDDMMVLFCKYRSTEEMNKLREYWKIGIKLLGIKEVVSQMAPYFEIYKKDVLGDKTPEEEEQSIQNLLNTNFAEHILPETNPKTEQLINKLIETFKAAWKDATLLDQKKIKLFIKKLTLQSIKINNINNTLKNLK